MVESDIIDVIEIKSAKGHLKQKFIDMTKFRMGSLSLDKDLMNELMGHVERAIKGVSVAQKWKKLNRQIESPKEPITQAFWDDLIRYAQSIGIDLIGFTEVDEYFIFEEEIMSYRVKNNMFDNAIVLGMEMKKELIDQAPEPIAGNEAFRVYADLGTATNKLADYLREHGYQAQAFHPLGGPVLFPPMAQKAGLGEIGYNGVLITKEFGARQRLSMIATEASPLPESPPSNLEIREYCKTCEICVRSCPTQAIFPGEAKKQSPDGKYLQNIDGEKCFPQFFKTHGCSICIKVCPFSQLGYYKVMANVSSRPKSLIQS
ncbi:MAG: 4Fe-4S double cluster binding domain-containing protein [Candidatus Helarchaeota archaeon]